MKHYNIAAIPADGIGPEVIAAGLQALEALARRDGSFQIDVTSFDWGSEYYRKHGVMMPADGTDQLKPFDAIFFGAVGAPDVPDHITLWGLRLPICQGFDQYANVRPTKILPGISSPLAGVGPGDLDWVIVRENSEGEYSGHGGRAHKGLPEEVGTEVAIFTRVGVTRIMRYAFKLAQSRPRKLLTVVTKSNAQRHGMVMWDEIAAEVATEFPDVTWDKMLVDAMTVRMTLKPQSIDTVVATNLHADILLMDEAFSALDPLIRTDMQSVLLDLQTELHKTIVFITHDLDEALRLGEQIAILRAGEIVQQGTAQDIVLRPADDYISSFVREVNRGRVIQVETVMEPIAPGEAPAPESVPIQRGTILEEAARRMTGDGVTKAHVVNGTGMPMGAAPICSRSCVIMRVGARSFRSAISSSERTPSPFTWTRPGPCTQVPRILMPAKSVSCMFSSKSCQ